MAPRLVVHLLLLLALAGPAAAVPVTAGFTASTFGVIGQGTAPENEVSGTLVYEWDPLTGRVLSLLSVDLEIASYEYKLAELVFAPEPGVQVGGENNGVNSHVAGTNDFIFGFGSSSGCDGALQAQAGSASFWYVTAGLATGSWYSTTVQITLSADASALAAACSGTDPGPGNQVSEPATLALLGLGLAGIGMARRRRR